MKLSNEACLVVMDITRRALEVILSGREEDLSVLVRELDLEPVDGVLHLSKEYLARNS